MNYPFYGNVLPSQDTIATLGVVFNLESAIFCCPLQNDGKYQGY
jgi:hypothetical protein